MRPMSRRNLDELYAGSCDGMTYKEIEEVFPEEVRVLSIRAKGWGGAPESEAKKRLRITQRREYPGPRTKSAGV